MEGGGSVSSLLRPQLAVRIGRWSKAEYPTKLSIMEFVNAIRLLRNSDIRREKDDHHIVSDSSPRLCR